MSSLNNAQQLMESAVSDGVFPGGVLLVSQDGDVLIHQAFGHGRSDYAEHRFRPGLFLTWHPSPNPLPRPWLS